MAEYYVVRDKNTGLYFRGKGVNRWGKYYNQASIYRIKANAENTIKEVSWRGEQAEIVPIQIVETTEDVVPKSEVDEIVRQWKEEANCWQNNYITEIRANEQIKAEVAREIFEEIEKNSKFTIQLVEAMEFDSEEIRKAKLECYRDCMGYFQKLKKKFVPDTNVGGKYTESEGKG